MTDQTVISPAALQAAITELNRQGAEQLLGRIQQAEPELGPFIQHLAVQVPASWRSPGRPPKLSKVCIPSCWWPAP